jgi:UDP-glucose 4-epimerase
MFDFNNINNKKITITGASGYIGAELVTTLISYGASVVRVSRSELAEIDGSIVVKADVNHKKTWDYIVNNSEIIYHLAGNTSIYNAEKYPVNSLKSTLIPLSHLVNSCIKYKRKPRVVFSSTATLYGMTTKLPVREFNEIKPVTVYDLHKYFAEQQLVLSTNLGIIEGVSLRLSNVYGPSSSASYSIDRGILNKVTTLALQGENITLYGDGNYIRDYIYIKDVIHAFIYAGVVENIFGQSFNVASGTGTSIKEVFNTIAKETKVIKGYEVKVNNIPWPNGMNSIEFRNFIADIDKFRSLTGWKPETTLRDGIIKLILDNNNRINFKIK